MQIILLERVPKLGLMGDVVTVKKGFARNYLLPLGKALRATDANRQKFEEQRLQIEARNLELKKEAGSVGERLQGEEFVVIRTASDTGSLYGSVNTRDIAEAASSSGVELSRRQIALERPIKEIGIHPVTVMLHPEVEVLISVNVARSMDEAETQSKGGSARDAEAEAEAQDEQELAEMFSEIAAATQE